MEEDIFLVTRINADEPELSSREKITRKELLDRYPSFATVIAREEFQSLYWAFDLCSVEIQRSYFKGGGLNRNLSL